MLKLQIMVCPFFIVPLLFINENKDTEHFGPDAASFNPERWLNPISASSSFTEKPTTGLNHLSFGAGSRACSGIVVAQRLLYAALIRLISSYKIVASESEPPNTDYVEYNAVKTALVAIPRDFKVRLVPRDGPGLETWLEEAEGRTGDFYK